jgi:hypothetical protein
VARLSPWPRVGVAQEGSGRLRKAQEGSGRLRKAQEGY